MIAYLPSFITGEANLHKKALQRIDMSEEEMDSLLTDQDDIEGNAPGEVSQKHILGETLNYNPSTADFSSPTSNTNRDTTDLNRENPADVSILLSSEDMDAEPAIDVDKEYESKYIPSEIIDYFSEAAMKAKVRNALPDEEFGIPRLRAYPLNDEKHVRLAINMFGHCKDPKDKALLAKNIFAKVDKFGMKVKIGKNNSLYEYAPKSLQETSLNGSDSLTTWIDPNEVSVCKRSKAQIVKEHLRKNNLFYDNIFYNGELAKALKLVTKYTFLDVFYPDFKHCSFDFRITTALGGLGRSTDLYSFCNLRSPTARDDSVGLLNDGLLPYPDQPDSNEFSVRVTTDYQANANWFYKDLSSDVDHVWYCMKLYSLINYLLNSSIVNVDDLDPRWNGFMGDWIQRVIYHYDLMNDAPEDSNEYYKQCQYLYDLCWAFCDNPLDDHVATANIITMIYNMKCCADMINNINEGTELISKTDLAAYLAHDLQLGNDIFLLPEKNEYPILSKQSVKMAMDIIDHIDPEDIRTYTTNLNKKYKELGCTFSITVDHPYAKYADDNIIAHMTQLLIEGDTTVDDNTDPEPDIGNEPWMKRVTEVEFSGDGFYPNREMGPAKGNPIKDWTRTDSEI